MQAETSLRQTNKKARGWSDWHRKNWLRDGDTALVPLYIPLQTGNLIILACKGTNRSIYWSVTRLQCFNSFLTKNMFFFFLLLFFQIHD